MQKFLRRYNVFVSNITFNYMCLKNWLKILLLPLWCIFILLSSMISTLIFVIYYVPKYKTKAYEQMVMDSIKNTFDAFKTEKETNI